MKKISEVLRLHFKLGLSLRKSSRSSKVSVGSASYYIARFKELSISIDDFLSLNELEQEKLFFPLSACSEPVAHASKAMPDYIYIHNELKNKRQTKVTLALLYEEYKESNPDNHYGSNIGKCCIKRYVN